MGSDPVREKRMPPVPLTTLPPAPVLDKEKSHNEEDEFAAWRELSSGAPTPNLSETMENLKRSLSFSTLQEMSTRPPAEVRRVIQKRLWRSKDEATRLPQDWERLLVYCTGAGGHAFVLSYGLRSTLSFLLTLAKALRARKAVDTRALKYAFFGEDAIRFALSFGLWAFLYKFMNNALRLLTPMPKGIAPDAFRRKPRRGVVELAEDSENGMVTDKKSEKSKKDDRKPTFPLDPRVRFWHPYVSGAVSSLALLVEKQSLLQSFSLQLLVRGLQGSFRMARATAGINIPYGSELAFGLANASIIWSWLVAPHLLDKGYFRWVDNAANLPNGTRSAYYASKVHRQVDPWDVEKVLGGGLPDPISESPLTFARRPPVNGTRGTSSRTFWLLDRWLKEGRQDEFPSCTLSHPDMDSHLLVSFRNFFETWRWIMPVYLTLYVVPSIFLRPRSLVKNPLGSVWRMVFGASRSSAFLGLYVAIVKFMFCFFFLTSDFFYYRTLRNHLPSTSMSARLARLFASDKWLAVAGFSSCLSLFVEHKNRRSELTSYVLPKGLEAFWRLGREHGVFPYVPFGNMILTAASLSMIMGTYAHSPESLSRLVTSVLYQFLGRN
ncbi:hypothetical protein MSPP1_001871 [Malassezia sp. CBS 17886]|nr:hypothetical protein MSPP1_001871 [Malassezia sp. CBS 17886]